MQATIEFGKGLVKTFEMAKAACREFPDRKMEEDLVLGLIVEMTEDQRFDYNAVSVERCSKMMDEMYETGNYDTHDKGVIFACNVIINGIEMTDGESRLLEIFIEENSPDLEPF